LKREDEGEENKKMGGDNIDVLRIILKWMEYSYAFVTLIAMG
jgi:hypothetical protein